MRSMQKLEYSGGTTERQRCRFPPLVLRWSSGRSCLFLDGGDRGGLTQDQAQEAARSSAERDADAEFLLALVHGIRDGGEEANHRQRHAKYAQHGAAAARCGKSVRLIRSSNVACRAKILMTRARTAIGTLTDPPVRRTPSPSSLPSRPCRIHLFTRHGRTICFAPEPGVPDPSLVLVTRRPLTRRPCPAVLIRSRNARALIFWRNK